MIILSSDVATVPFVTLPFILAVRPFGVFVSDTYGHVVVVRGRDRAQMKQLPFDKPGRFWKGNLHTHSTRSDGKLTPAEVVAAYRARGDDFLAIADHFMARFGYPIVDTTGYRDERFTTLIAAELHGPALSYGDIWHILAV